jgi:hypothetical protein
MISSKSLAESSTGVRDHISLIFSQHFAAAVGLASSSDAVSGGRVGQARFAKAAASQVARIARRCPDPCENSLTIEPDLA